MVHTSADRTSTTPAGAAAGSKLSNIAGSNVCVEVPPAAMGTYSAGISESSSLTLVMMRTFERVRGSKNGWTSFHKPARMDEAG